MTPFTGVFWVCYTVIVQLIARKKTKVQSSGVHSGPPGARVDAVEIREEVPRGELNDFRVT